MSEKEVVELGSVYVRRDIEFSTGSVLVEGIEDIEQSDGSKVGYVVVRSLGIGGPNADKTFKFYTPEDFLQKYEKPSELQTQRLHDDLVAVSNDLGKKLLLLEQHAQSQPKLTPTLVQAGSPFGSHPDKKDGGFAHPDKKY